MKLNELLRMIQNDVQKLTGEENPEVIFASTINDGEIVGGEYDGVFQLDDGTVVIDIMHEEEYKEDDEDEEDY